MAHAGEHHGNTVLVGGIDDFLVAHRAARLDHGGDADLGRLVEAVAERKNASEAMTLPRTSSPASVALIEAMRAL